MPLPNQWEQCFPTRSTKKYATNTGRESGLPASNGGKKQQTLGKSKKKNNEEYARSNKTASDGNGKADKQKVENQIKFTSKHQQEKQKLALLGLFFVYKKREHMLFLTEKSHFSGSPPRCSASTAEGTKAIASAWWIAIAPTSPLDRQVLFLESGNTDLEP